MSDKRRPASRAARSMLRLASCCDRRQRQLEKLAKRCADIGLEPRDVDSLIDIARRYEAFGRALLRYCDCDPRERTRLASYGRPSIDEAFREVMDSRLPEPTKRDVRAAYRDLWRHARDRSALADPNPA